ncbi:hypothetical protein B9J88_06385 [Vibrio sp. V05_P4A8T149]|nr:hypothetical protein B9J88_06385 [Vibrio sp. V05_P4A8T149]OXX31015.1 hypothetical protein B9J95_09865 [Vibrio sp. V14_P6S14T42]OXX33318.1 hypothetical protein B9J81_10490 [Vibrio sp. V04_P4A5T148]OXX60459.1 hypothetical protein B9J91_01620 [Vibrio sp. V18_P1S4T112]
MLATGINMPVYAYELSVNHDSPYMKQSVEGDENILGNIAEFIINDDEGDRFILSSDEWIQIQFFATTAKALPITEQDMRNQFQMTDDVVMDGVYTDLLQSYSNINSLAGEWLDPQGHKDQMISLAADLSSYSGTVVTSGNVLYTMVNRLTEAAIAEDEELFNKYKSAIKGFLVQMRDDTVRFNNDGKALGDKLTSFINLLAQEKINLDQVEERNADILTNDGSAIQEKIARLIAEKDALNDEYSKWVTVAGTSPTYAWLFPWGTLAAIGSASAGTAYALELKERLENKAQELEDANIELTQTIAIYQSWVLAKGNVVNIRSEIVKANQSLGKLRGGWATILGQLNGVLSIIDNINSKDVLDNTNIFTAAFQTQSNVSLLQDKWRKVEALSEKWIENAYVNPVSKMIFRLDGSKSYD